MPRTPDDDPTQQFLARLRDALAAASLVRLVLSKARGAGSDRVRTTVRPVQLKGTPMLSFTDTYRTRDITTNLPPAAALAQVRGLLGTHFSHAHLFTAADEVTLLISKKGRATLRHDKADASAAPPTPVGAAAHDRAKRRWVDIKRPFLAALGVTHRDAAGGPPRLVPAMARKWKQINKFVEVFDHALEASALKAAAHIDVVDFGSGKGYLTFALHDHLHARLGQPVQVTGVELRADLVALCNDVVQRLALDGLRFEQGDVRSSAAARLDVMIALHACDTATDHAIATGVRGGAAIILCSPCCHKELRPQLLQPHPLRPILRHGVHLGQQAEMLTDSLRAMLLDACGYDTQVFEFVALEHTNKNKMILAVKRAAGRPTSEVWQQIDGLKAFYGIRDQCLETLLHAERARQAGAHAASA